MYWFTCPATPGHCIPLGRRIPTEIGATHHLIDVKHTHLTLSSTIHGVIIRETNCYLRYTAAA